MPSNKKRVASVAVSLLLLQLLLLLLLLQLLLLLLLRLLRRLLLARLDVGFVLRSLSLFLTEVLSALGPLQRILRRLLPRLVELALIISLLLIIRRLVRDTLWCFRAALRSVKFVLALFLREGLRIARISSGTLRRLRQRARLLDRLVLIPLQRTRRALLFVESELLRLNLRLHAAHLVARAVDTSVHEEPVIAIVHRHAVLVLILGTARIERFLTRIPIICRVIRGRSGGCGAARPLRSTGGLRGMGSGACIRGCGQALCMRRERHSNEHGA